MYEPKAECHYSGHDIQRGVCIHCGDNDYEIDHLVVPKDNVTDINVGDILNERGNRYGEFSNHSHLSQELKLAFHNHVEKHGQPEGFTDAMIESIDMIMHKLARIANGDPQYKDSWVDIAGYATLVADTLE